MCIRDRVDTPEALVAEQAPIVLFVPVAENVGTTPTSRLLFVSLRVIVTVDAAMPSARTGPVPVMVELVAPAPAMMSSSVFETTVNRWPAVALTGTTVVPVSATAGQRFTVVSNTLELIIAGAGATNSTITGTGPVLADGIAASTVTITLKDTNNNLLVGVVPTFSATGTNNTIGACSATNASGVSTCSLQSTTAEVKTLAIVTPVSDVGGTVTFTEP